MVRIDLIDSSRNVTYERKMPAPRVYAQPAPIKLTKARCLKALIGLSSFAVISLVLAIDRFANGQELLIGAVLAYTGLTYLARALMIWRLYGRVSRGETIYVPGQPSSNISVAVAIALTGLVLLISAAISGLLFASGVNILVRTAAAFMAVMLWSMVFQCWKRALRS